MTLLSITAHSGNVSTCFALSAVSRLIGSQLRQFNSSSVSCKDQPLEGSSPSSGELYGREDRDPSPSPNPSVKQATLNEMSFPRDDPDSKTQGIKPEGTNNPNAYPVQNDPSVPEGPGPNVEKIDANAAEQLAHQDPTQSDGPKAAGQGVVETLGQKDPEQYGSGRGGPEAP